MVVREESYTAASAFPIKILLNPKLVKSIGQGFIPPVHIQLNPTNNCNLHCPWCSCSARDRKQEISYEEIMRTMSLAKKYGCQAVTITGGGEPLMHQEIKDIIISIRDIGIEVGMVTNGWALEQKLDKETLNEITWIRISLGDGREEKDNIFYWTRLDSAVKRGNKVDWSFSYVVTAKPDYELMEMMIEFANRHNFTHIRLVNDIFVADELRNVMAKVREHMRLKGIDDHLVIYQDRSEWAPGTKDCYIRFLKPVIGADGYWYPCCGVQYALAKPSRDYEKMMRMSKKRGAAGLKEIVESQKDPKKQKVCASCGSMCVKCYYSNYNKLLKILKDGIRHRVFV